ncbi:MAG TPA: PhzF family phenazine biosynthesis protein [Vicinamibacterales bacterium]|jgi:trans-2,3-dihydro-3-hydroxyanthranilate isomerase|nr:PhzF family phenazine biosynthesis protein [Vicinamibacterales bacterium]
MTYAYLHYDVFTDSALTGNQLAVFTNPEGLTTDDMTRITREMNYSECTFIQPPEHAGTDIRLRIFCPDGEMPFAGHPVIGSTFAAAHEGLVKPGQGCVTFGLGLGPTPVDLEWKGAELWSAWMTQQLPKYGATLDARDRVAQVLGIDAAAIRDGVPIQEISCGLPFLFVPVTSRAAVDQCVLDVRAADAMLKESGLTSRGIFVFSTEASDDDATAYSRMLGTDREDPATGSASGPLGCYVVRYGLVPPDRSGRIVSRQGVKMGRPSRVRIRIAGAPDTITDVKVGGESVLVGDGRITKL